jgi:hypothetical protein
MLKKLNRFLLLVLALVVAGWVALALTPPKPDTLALQDGDLVFQTNFDTQGLAVMLASRSPYTHMGIIRLRQGKAMVVEAVGPVTETPLRQWIARGTGKRMALMRVKDLAPNAAAKVFARAKREYGKPYDIYFLPGLDAIYCSELVRLSFEAAGITLGKIEKVGDLADSPAVDRLIEERWERYPPCKGVKGMTLEKCRGIIMQQELVTPASIADDSRVELIYSNYPLDK